MKTLEEEKIKDSLLKSGELWNSILKINLKNEFDIKDVLFHIHAIQNILYTNMYIDKHGYIGTDENSNPN